MIPSVRKMRLLDVGYPKKGCGLKGLARVTFIDDVPSWEFDIRAVPAGTEPLQISDWHRRQGGVNNRDGNIERAAAARIAPLREQGREQGSETERGD